ncbi:hypothetical protein ACOJTA_07955, partial [Malaciobacter sp. WC5094]
LFVVPLKLDGNYRQISPLCQEVFLNINLNYEICNPFAFFSAFYYAFIGFLLLFFGFFNFFLFVKDYMLKGYYY